MPKRVTLFAGHYGSGKTNIAVNYALRLRRAGVAVSLADLDIVNPYYRAKDSEEALSKAGIPLVCSEFANSNVDLPALPDSLYSIADLTDRHFVVDVGGDDRGALALGRLTPALLAEGNFEMLLVINAARPLTSDVNGVLAVRGEIEAACRLPFTGIVNNTNLGTATTVQTVLEGLPFAHAVSEATGLPILYHTAKTELCEALATAGHPLLSPEKLLPLQLQDVRLWH